MFSRFFIERPIFAAVVAILLCLAGLVAMTQLPVQQYPAITPVQVTVQATYPGADSKTLADSVASPIEAQINGVDNMLYMSSTSSANGQLVLTVYFSLNTDPDIAQVQVQNRVNLALPSALARRMMRSYWRGSVNWACVTTGKVSCTLPGLGSWPIWPAPNSAFCWFTALAMSLVVMLSEAMRSGFIQMRMAWSGAPMICAWPAPGTRLMASST